MIYLGFCLQQLENDLCRSPQNEMAGVGGRISSKRKIDEVEDDDTVGKQNGIKRFFEAPKTGRMYWFYWFAEEVEIVNGNTFVKGEKPQSCSYFCTNPSSWFVHGKQMFLLQEMIMKYATNRDLFLSLEVEHLKEKSLIFPSSSSNALTPPKIWWS